MDQNPKQQVAESLRSSANVLITVSKNPSVDQLAAAIGLSLMLNKLGKHTATVFGGSIPDILKFLEPEKTFDDNVDGLRDFIISLDKDKADKLRYKVEDDVVKVYITPYKSKITESDLTFTQGDFNIDVVMALGVKKKADLDEAITAHGRILHGAKVIAVNAGEVGGDVGSIDWTDPNANSLSEMIVSISEALEGGLLDAPMSTAFLTGIVSVTERFSNEKTTPKLMTMAAQLMAAGANQQLISKELQLGGAATSSAEVKLDKSGSDEQKDDATLDLRKEKAENTAESPEESAPLSLGDQIADLEKSATDTEEVSVEETPQEVAESQPPSPDQVAEELNLGDVEKQLSEEVEPQAVEPEVDEEPSEVIESPEFDIPNTGEEKSPTELPQVEIGSDGQLTGLGSSAPSTLQHHDIAFGDDASGAPEEAPDPAVVAEQPAPQASGIDSPQSEPMPSPDASLEDARRAVEQASLETPFNPANNPVESLNAVPIGAGDAQTFDHQQGPFPAEPLPAPEMAPPMPDALNMPSPLDPSSPYNQPVPGQMPAAAPPVPPPSADAQTFSIPSPATDQVAAPMDSNLMQMDPNLPPPPAGVNDLPPPPPMPS